MCRGDLLDDRAALDYLLARIVPQLALWCALQAVVVEGDGDAACAAAVYGAAAPACAHVLGTYVLPWLDRVGLGRPTSHGLRIDFDVERKLEGPRRNVVRPVAVDGPHGPVEPFARTESVDDDDVRRVEFHVSF